MKVVIESVVCCSNDRKDGSPKYYTLVGWDRQHEWLKAFWGRSVRVTIEDNLDDSQD